MNRSVILTCAVTGDGDTAGKHPQLPITPAQIAAAAVEAARAGAAVAHIHVRDPDTGKGSRDTALYRETVARIRDSGVDMVINLTAGMGGKFMPFRPEQSDLVDALERMVHIENIRPEICSLDCGSMNFGSDSETYISTPAMIRAMATRIRELGVKPELEIFDLGHLRLAVELHRQGLVADPPFFQFALGIPWGAPADARTMTMMRDMLPAHARWAAFGIGPAQMPMVAQSILLGGHARVGLEDNLYLSRGVFASNAQLVERAVSIIQSIGADPMRPREARAALGLAARDAEVQSSMSPINS
jgi:uncharacterized protein (DUF849 family)